MLKFITNPLTSNKYWAQSSRLRRRVQNFFFAKTPSSNPKYKYIREDPVMFFDWKIEYNVGRSPAKTHFVKMYRVIDMSKVDDDIVPEDAREDIKWVHDNLKGMYAHGHAVYNPKQNLDEMSLAVIIQLDYPRDIVYFKLAYGTDWEEWKYGDVMC